MHTYRNIDDVKDAIAKNTIALLYVSSVDCGVCNVIYPRLTDMLKSLPSVKAIKVNIDEVPLIAGEYNVFTIPCILIFAEGKEVGREARYIDIAGIEGRIARYYRMFEIEGM